MPGNEPDKRKGERPVKEAARDEQPQRVREPPELEAARKERQEDEEAEKGKA